MATLALCLTLAAASATDLRRGIIPNRLLACSALAGVVMTCAERPGALAGRALAAAAAGGLLLILAELREGGLGMGDVKLGFVLGLYLGAAVFPALLAAFCAGAAAGAVQLVRGGRAARAATIPFAPALAFGGIVGLLAGQRLLAWYLHFTL